MSEDKLVSRKILRWQDGTLDQKDDLLISEAPLQITLKFGPAHHRQYFTLAITMRSPGHDDELVYGFLYAEQIISKIEDIRSIRHLSNDHLVVELSSSLSVLSHQLQRNVITSSSCGACGLTSLDQLNLHIPWNLIPNKPKLTAEQILAAARELDKKQHMFSQTGGNHVAALFMNGRLLTTREDVGRHNALDKLIGYALRHLTFPLEECYVIMSSRASFELVQKSLVAGIPFFATVGAASSLAVQLAEQHGSTLIGFLRGRQFNVYTSPERVICEV